MKAARWRCAFGAVFLWFPAVAQGEEPRDATIRHRLVHVLRSPARDAARVEVHAAHYALARADQARKSGDTRRLALLLDVAEAWANAADGVEATWSIETERAAVQKRLLVVAAERQGLQMLVEEMALRRERGQAQLREQEMQAVTRVQENQRLPRTVSKP